MGSRREEAYLEANRITVLTSTIVRGGKIAKERDGGIRNQPILITTQHPHPPTQLQSSEQLLTQAEQLKRIHVLQDMEALNAEVDADTRALEAR
jgi:hypothetical protein